MRDRLRIVFMGSPDFAVPCLEALIKHHDVVAVVTQPDRPKGRGRALTAPPVKVAAEAAGITVLQPPTLRRRSVRQQLQRFEADAFVVVAFGQILRPKMLAVPRLGCFNVHGSLLPAYRGAAPIQWAVLDGQPKTGVSIMRLDEGLDSGPVMLTREIELLSDETSATLYQRLAPLGAEALIEAMAALRDGTAVFSEQDHSQATHARMLSKQDGLVDFAQPAARVDCWIRGMDSWPGAFAYLDDKVIKLYGASRALGAGVPGQVLSIDERGACVACGDKAVWVRELQLPGKRRMTAQQLASGRLLSVGSQLLSGPAASV
jgi:methionyl-tRNA formyltransferase